MQTKNEEPMTCICQSWIDRLWKPVDRFGYIAKRCEMKVNFYCPEHGHVEMDNRSNPVPHIDARDPIKEHAVSRMIEQEADSRMKEREKRRGFPPRLGIRRA